jgi:hypothetical protein
VGETRNPTGDAKRRRLSRMLSSAKCQDVGGALTPFGPFILAPNVDIFDDFVVYGIECGHSETIVYREIKTRVEGFVTIAGGTIKNVLQEFLGFIYAFQIEHKLLTDTPEMTMSVRFEQM